MFVFTTCSPCTVNNHAPVTSTKHLSSLSLPTLLVVKGGEGGGGSLPYGHSHNCDRGQDLDHQFFTVWLMTKFGGFDRSLKPLTPLVYLACCKPCQPQDGTCGSWREPALLNIGCTAGIKVLWLVCYKFHARATCSVQRSKAASLPGPLLISQPTGMAKMQRWLPPTVALITAYTWEAG